MKKLVATVFLLITTLAIAGDGAELYKKCAACHGQHGEKKALGKSEPIAGWETEKLVEALDEYKKGTRNIHGMGALMKGQVRGMSDDDIKSVAEYIHTLKK